jgi:hypothetical protein
MAGNWPCAHVGDVVCVPLYCKTQQTATGADIAKNYVPCNGRIVMVTAHVETIGGTTKCTDYDLMVEKNSTDVLSAAIAAVNTSTNKGPQAGTLVTSPTILKVAQGDILTLDATLTGGSSPTVDGPQAYVYIVRES